MSDRREDDSTGPTRPGGDEPAAGATEHTASDEPPVAGTKEHTAAGPQQGPETVSVEIDGAPAARRALARCVTTGGVALFPADTVYGLACDPLSEQAVARIGALKGRPERKPSAVMYFSVGMLRELLLDLPEPVAIAASRLLPGPVTCVVPNPRDRYPLASGGGATDRLGVRLIEGPLAGAGCVVLQTSANPSGGRDPQRVVEVERSIRAGVDLIVDAGTLPGTPSTVVDLAPIATGGAPAILREAALSEDEVLRRLAATPG